MTMSGTFTRPVSFINIQVAREDSSNGFTLVTCCRKSALDGAEIPRQQKISESKLRKKISTKINEPLDEHKLFNDTQQIQEMYQKAGYPRLKSNTNRSSKKRRAVQQLRS